MGGRKSVTFQIDGDANEDKASNACPDTILCVENDGNRNPNGAKKAKNSRVRSGIVKRSARIKSLTSPPKDLDVVEALDLKEDDAVPCLDISYRSLYIKAQKKIEALLEDNYELVRKLEFARGKIAAYEMVNDALGGRRELVPVSTAGRAVEDSAAIQVSSPTPTAGSLHDATDDPIPKPNRRGRKRKLTR